MFFKHQRKPNRLHHYDYSTSGIYFITICTAARQKLLGEVVNGKMILNQKGAIAEKSWEEIPAHFPSATLDIYVLMPNHIHGIISIEENLESLTPQRIPPHGYPRTKMLIPKIVQQFKASVTRKIRTNLHDYCFEWQRSYYDHIVRDERALEKIRHYIQNNPIKWQIEVEKRNNERKQRERI